MTIRSRITTKGFEEYLELLVKKGADVDAMADDALLAGGEPLLEGMQRRVPKDTSNLEQKLSIDGPHQEGNFHYIDVGLNKGVDADTARYGAAQEFGWADRQGGKSGQPYIRPTLDSDMGRARSRMKTVFKTWLEQA